MFKKIEKTENDANIIANLIKKSFSGFPWYEPLSNEECLGRILKDFQRNNFFGYLFFLGQTPIAANWIDLIYLEQIEKQRGKELADFVKKLGIKYAWWGRDLVVDPDYQNKGYGTKIRIKTLQELRGKDINKYIFTRMRQDNIASIKICEKLGYSKTGILVPSSQIKNLFHEYYYLKL